MKVTLFGGAFDPPHQGHLQVVQTILKRGLADEVWFVPTYRHSFDKKMSPVDQRLKMLELVLVPQTKIETCEIERKGESITYQTLQQLRQLYPEHQFSWLIGSDNLSSFSLWHDYQKMLQEFEFYVYPRAGYPLEPLYPGMTPLTEVEQVGISSTEIRQKLSLGERIDGLVPEPVRKYLLERKNGKS
ncbi:MAG: nicotinate (nicotinamide) nucleotide adenylyltransferase [Candidatus Pacebacteria bacterium]|nr:nicotinate (nicotinamide) nucleotide adenylyltransferase [Candidatus Paceibacterota bacterium]